MEVADGEQFFLASREPAATSRDLTLGAVPIAATNGELTISCLMESNFYWRVSESLSERCGLF